MATAHEQYLRARNDVESSLINVRSICDRWQRANRGENPDNLSKKDIDQLAKSFKNKLLTLKWDCEDLEEIVNHSDTDHLQSSKDEFEDCRRFIMDTKLEIQQLMDQLGEGESKGRIFSKHGIAIPNPTNSLLASTISGAVNSGAVNSGAGSGAGSAGKYERLTTSDGDVVEFDIAMAGDVADKRHDGKDSARLIHSNSHTSLGRSGAGNGRLSQNNKVTIHVNPNDNEMMLDMLEAEYYQPQPSLHYSQLNLKLRQILETVIPTKLVSALVTLLTVVMFILYIAI